MLVYYKYQTTDRPDRVISQATQEAQSGWEMISVIARPYRTGTTYEVFYKKVTKK